MCISPMWAVSTTANIKCMNLCDDATSAANQQQQSSSTLIEWQNCIWIPLNWRNQNFHLKFCVRLFPFIKLIWMERWQMANESWKLISYFEHATYNNKSKWNARRSSDLFPRNRFGCNYNAVRAVAVCRCGYWTQVFRMFRNE